MDRLSLAFRTMLIAKCLTIAMFWAPCPYGTRARSSIRQARKLHAPLAAERLSRSPSTPAKMRLEGDGDAIPIRLLIEPVPISVLTPDPRNARTHTKQQISQIAESIREFGFVNPLLIDERDRVIAGPSTPARS